MRFVDVGEYVAVIVGTSRELSQKRKEHIVAAFLIGVPKIKIEIS